MSNSVLIDGGLQIGNLPELPNEQNLVFYYSFNGGTSGSTVSNPILDNSGNGISGSVHNGSPKFSDGVFGNAVQFLSESEDRIKVTNRNCDFGKDDNFSLSIWAKRFHPNTGSADPTVPGTVTATGLFGKDRPGDNDYYGIDYGLVNNEIRAGIRNSTDGQTQVEHQMSDDLLDWHHIVFTYTANSSTGIKLYVDGELKASRTTVGLSEFKSTDKQLELGGDDSGGGNRGFFNGFLDEPRVYSKTLSASEVRALYLNPSAMGSTNISGDEISTGKIQSNNFSATEGTELDLNNATVKLGGSSNPEFEWDGTNLRVSGSKTEFITPSFFFGSATNNISSSDVGISITTENLSASGSSVDILTDNFLFGNSQTFISGSSDGVQISGSNIDLQTPSVFLGQGTTNFISASGGSIEISSSNFHLKNGNITASNVDLSGKISATSGDIGGFTIGTSQINDSSNDLILKDTGEITGSNVLFDGGKIGGFSINEEKLQGTAPSSLMSNFHLNSISSSVEVLGQNIVTNNEVGFGVIQASFGQTKRINTFEEKTGIDIGITNGSSIYKSLFTINETTQSIGSWSITDDSLQSGNFVLSGSQEVLLVKDVNSNNVVVVGRQSLSSVSPSTNNLFTNPGFELDSDGDTSPENYKLNTTATHGSDGFPTGSNKSQRTIFVSVVDDNPQAGSKNFRIRVLRSSGSQQSN